MSEALFFDPPKPLALSRVAEIVGAALPEGSDGSAIIANIAPIESAGAGDLTFLDNTKYLGKLADTRATACLITKSHAARVPKGTVALAVGEPLRAMAEILAVLYPAGMRPVSVFGADGVAPGAIVHPTAKLESGVVVDPGVVVGAHAEIGAGSILCAGAVIGPHVKIGRGSAIGMGVTLQHALIGNRVILHPGVRIGQDGFGFAMGPGGHLKIPQVGRVIIQDDVEIGANTTVDRGSNRDTVIGEGTKIDNLVQIAHNVVIGRHCVIVAQVGIAGSVTLEDYVVLAGQVGVAGHVTIGMGAQIAATSNVATDVPAGVRWGGTPAKPVRDWFREVTALKLLAERKSSGTGEQGTPRGD